MKLAKKGYTLLEILVVMAIIAVLLYMLTRMMANFRRTVELQQASDMIISSINETKNYSINNILPDGEIVDKDYIYAYKLEIDSTNNLKRSACKKKPTEFYWQCELGAKVDYFLQNMSNKIVFIGNNDCESIFLINLTGDWQTGDVASFPNGTCRIEMSHRDDSDIFREFIFNSEKNTFEIEYGS